MHDGDDLGGSCQISISNKLAFIREIGKGTALHLHAAGFRAGRPGAGFLRFHGRLEAFPVDADARLGGEIDGQVEGKAVRVVQAEGVLPADRVLPFGLGPPDQLLQNLQAFADRFVEPFLLGADHLLDEGPLLHHFRVVGAHDAADGFHEPVHERFMDAQRLAVPHGAAQQAADDVAAPFVARQDAVADGEGDGPDVVGDHLQGHVRFFLLPVAGAGDVARLQNDREEQVGVEVGVHILQHGGKPLQSGAGVDVFAREGRVAAVLVVVELGKHVVPHFQEPLVFPAGPAFRIGQVAVPLAPVVENFRAGTARAFPDVPEVVLHPVNPPVRQADLFMPDFVGFLVFRVDRHRQPVRIETEPLSVGQELPAPRDRFFLEIVPDRKIAQHLEKRMVPPGFPHVFDVVGADAFLHVGDARVVRFDAPVEIRLQRRHAGVDPEQRRIVAGHQRGARFDLVAFRGEKVHPFLTDFACFHACHPLLPCVCRPPSRRACPIRRLRRPSRKKRPTNRDESSAIRGTTLLIKRFVRARNVNRSRGR